MPSASAIGLLNEKPLHAALKECVARPGDQFEVPVDGFVIDIVRDGTLIEVQTANFAAIKKKLTRLVPYHPLRLIYPIAREKWIVKIGADGKPGRGRRKSPKRGQIEELFHELVSFPELLLEENFGLEVLFIQEEEVRRHDPTVRWRRRAWRTEERRLLAVVEQRVFEHPQDVSALLPPELSQPFTTLDLAKALGRPRWVAQKMAYCLRGMEEIVPVGKQGRSILYSRSG